MLLGALGSFLAEFRRERARQHGEERVLYAVECKAYETGPMVEVWAEVDLSEQQTVVYSMDLAPEMAGWSIAASLRMDGSEGSDTLRTLAERRGLTVQEMKNEAPGLLSQLLALNPP